MSDCFDSLPWHDAELLELSIDRRRPGERDEVRLKVVWPHGDEATLLFRDCYGMAADMNFGVIAEERIASGRVVDDDAALSSIRARWRLLGVSLDILRCYRIEIASTSSVVRIFAKRVEVLATGNAT